MAGTTCSVLFPVAAPSLFSPRASVRMFCKSISGNDKTTIILNPFYRMDFDALRDVQSGLGTGK